MNITFRYVGKQRVAAFHLDANNGDIVQLLRQVNRHAFPPVSRRIALVAGHCTPRVLRRFAELLLDFGIWQAVAVWQPSSQTFVVATVGAESTYRLNQRVQCAKRPTSTSGDPLN